MAKPMPTLPPDFEKIAVLMPVSRPTVGPERSDGKKGAREIEALYLAAIASARRFLYIESQYFASHIAEAIAARLEESDGPEIVVINPEDAMGWLEAEAMETARSVLLARVRDADRHGRFRILAPVTQAGRGIYVHAKVLVVDDRFLRVGSSNINNRSMGLDTECDLAVEAGPDEGVDSVKRRSIRAVRTRLMAEHLGVTTEEFERTEEAEGSLVATVDRLMRSSGRTLIPLAPEPVSDAERTMVDTRLLDPDRPEAMSKTMERGALVFQEVDTAVWRAGLAIAAGLGLTWIAATRYRARLRDG